MINQRKIHHQSKVNQRIRLFLLFSLLVLFWWHFSPAAMAQGVGNKSGVKPQVISLPSGPGSLEGLGESFEPDLSTGTATYPYPLSFPPGVNGFEPDLSLIYNGGHPNGPWGLGWRLNLPYIQRQTDKGLPDYTMGDRFVFHTGEELVPIGNNFYRFENEASFMRFRWLPATESWEAHAPDGTLYEFGAHRSSRILTSYNGSEATFRWSLERQVDTNGNEIRFFYKRLDAGPCIYLSEVRYNFSSDGRHDAIKFFYEDRPDVFADRTSRAAITYAFRASQIDIYALGKNVRRYHFDYEPEASTKMHSLLTKITVEGDDGVSTFPPTTFKYTRFEPDAYAVVYMSEAPAVGLNNSNTSLIDMTYDGLPDFVYTPDDYEQYLFVNQGHGRWHTAIQNDVGVARLGREDVKIADMDGNGQIDLLKQASGTEIYYYSTKPGELWDVNDLVPYEAWSSPYFDVSDPQIQLIDINNDKLIDILALGEDVYRIWLAPDNLRWSPTPDYIVDVLVEGLPRDTEYIRFADMTGDRLQDLVVVREGHFSYFPHNGAGDYDSERIPDDAPVWLSEDAVNDLLLGDINNDGLADIVYPRSRQVRYWLNLGNDSFSRTITIPTPDDTTTFIPELIAGETSVELADMNGDGSVDLVYGQPNGIIQYVDFNTGSQPNLLQSIDNGLGRTFKIEYEPSTAFYVADYDSGNPWQTSVPFPIQVVSRMSVYDANSGDDYVIDYHYRDGYYDGDQKEFRGFAEVVETRYGDETAPTTITRHVYDTGATNESRKGLLLEQTIVGEGGECSDGFTECYQRQVNQVSTRLLYDDGPDRQVAYSFVTQTDIYIHEQQASPVQLRQTYEWDDYGNLIQEFNYGQVCGTDITCGDDEVLTYTDYAYNTEAWIVNHPSHRYQTDVADNFVSDVHLHYDGEPYVGLPLGQVTRGNLTHQEESLGPLGENRFIPTVRQDFDRYGNVVGIQDANGNLTTIEYDLLQHTFPVLEQIHLDDGRSLSYTAAYDPGFGTVTSATDFNGHASTFAYDTFGRLTKIVLPGDTLDLPTQQFTYTLGSPRSSITTAQRERSGTSDVLLSVTYFDGLGRVLQMRREAEDGRVVVEEATTFNARQGVRDQFFPYFDDSFDYVPPSPSFPRTTQHYDPLERVVRAVNSDGSFTSVNFQPFVQVQFDEEDNQPDSPYANTPKILTFDGLERLVGVQGINLVAGEMQTYTTSYTYDRLDNLIQLTDAQGNVKTMAYDGLSRKVRMNDLDRGQMLYTYDDNGNLLRTEDAKGQVVYRTYDAADRLLTEWWEADDGSPIYNAIYHYDSDLAPEHPDARNTLGRIAYIEDLAGTVYFSYDARNNLNGRIRHFADEDLSFVTRMAYDAMDRVVALTYPDGSVVNYEYNERGLLERIPGFIDALNYTASGQRARAAYANGVDTEYGYDVRLRLEHLQTVNGQNALQDLTYVFDDASNIVSIADARPDVTADNDQSQIFSYDSLYRLTGAIGTYGQIDYSYDSIGNMVQKTSTAADSRLNLGEMVYGQNGAGPHALSVAAEITYTYDSNGNLTNKGEATYTWDPLDRLMSVVNGDMVSTYVYDSNGQRTHQTVQSGEQITTTLYIDRYSEVQGDTLIRYVLNDQQRVTRMTVIFEPSQLLKGFSNQIAVDENMDLTYYWYITDHLNGTRLLLNEAGQVASEMIYYPFGLTRYEANGDKIRYGFTGKELDASGLYYHGARYYDATMGQFINPDPLYTELPEKGKTAPQLLNLYSYTINSPLIYIDPNGQEPKKTIPNVDPFPNLKRRNPEAYKEARRALRAYERMAYFKQIYFTLKAAAVNATFSESGVHIEKIDFSKLVSKAAGDTLWNEAQGFFNKKLFGETGAAYVDMVLMLGQIYQITKRQNLANLANRNLDNERFNRKLSVVINIKADQLFKQTRANKAHIRQWLKHQYKQFDLRLGEYMHYDYLEKRLDPNYQKEPPIAKPANRR